MILRGNKHLNITIWRRYNIASRCCRPFRYEIILVHT